MPPSVSSEQQTKALDEGVECEDCLLREQGNQSRYLRIPHSDRGRLLPNGRPLTERCETCGGSGRAPYRRCW